MRRAILDGREIEKPGFVRLNFSALLSDAKADFILASVLELASDAADFEGLYDFDPSRAIFFRRAPRWPPRPDPSFRRAPRSSAGTNDSCVLVLSPAPARGYA